MKTWKGEKFLPIAAAVLTAVSVSMTGTVVEKGPFLSRLTQEMDGLGIEKLIVLVAAAVFYSREWEYFKKAGKWITHILSALLAGFMVIGISFSTLGSWAFLLDNKKQLGIALVTMAGYWILFDFVLTWLYRRLSACRFGGEKEKKLPAFMEKHFFLCAFGMIFLCWLPWLVIFYPGSVPWDGWRQIWMFFGYSELTNQHPWQVTMLIGTLMSLGRKVSDNFGVFTVVLTFSVIEALGFAAVCSKIKKWKAPRWVIAGTPLFFGIVPLFANYAQAILKDSIFTPMFAWYVAVLLDLCLCGKEKTEKEYRTDMLCLLLSGLLVCMTRRNGMYLVLPSLLLLFAFTEKKRMGYMLAVTVALLVLHMGGGNYMAGRLGVVPGSVRAMLAIPFQQTARYVKAYPEDVTEEEEKAIRAVLAYDKLAEVYDPQNYDPVKETFAAVTADYSEEKLKESLKVYFKAWFSMFLRHPGVCLEASIHGSYGYYYPFHDCKVQGTYQTYTKRELREHFDVFYTNSRAAQRGARYWSRAWLRFPGISQLLNPGMYTWILLLAAGYLLYCRRWKGILALAAPTLNVAVCIASPINGLVRYAFPVLACLPAIICWSLKYAGIKKGSDA